MEVRPKEAQLSPNSKLWGFQLWCIYGCLVGEPRSREWNCPNNGLAGSSTCVTFSYWLRLRPRSPSLQLAELAQGPFPSSLFSCLTSGQWSVMVQSASYGMTYRGQCCGILLSGKAGTELLWRDPFKAPQSCSEVSTCSLLRHIGF